MLRRSHERIQVDARAAPHRSMKLRVDIVRPALKRLNPIPFTGKQRHQPPGNCRLARATVWRRYQKSMSHTTCKFTKKLRKPIVLEQLIPLDRQWIIRGYNVPPFCGITGVFNNYYGMAVSHKSQNHNILTYHNDSWDTAR